MGEEGPGHLSDRELWSTSVAAGWASFRHFCPESRKIEHLEDGGGGPGLSFHIRGGAGASFNTLACGMNKELG